MNWKSHRANIKCDKIIGKSNIYICQLNTEKESVLQKDYNDNGISH